MVVCWLEPVEDIAVTVMLELPVGVMTLAGPLPPQPRARAAVVRPRIRSASELKRRRARVVRRRRRSVSSDSGKSEASARVGRCVPRCGHTALPVLVFMPMVVMVSVVVAGAEELTVSEVGVKMQAAPAGRPLQEKVTVPLKPLTGAAASVAVAELPAGTVAPGAEALKAKVALAPETVALLMEARRPCASLASPATK